MGSINTSGGESEVKGGPTPVIMEHDKTFSGTFGIGGGYFLTSNIAVGANFMLSGSKLTPADTADAERKSSGMGIGVFARYYVPMGDRFYFFGHLGYGLGTSQSTSIKNGNETEGPKTTTNSLGIKPGFAFFPSEKIAFDMTWGNLGWAGSKTESTNGPITSTNTTSGMEMSFNLTTVSFGIHYFLR